MQISQDALGSVPTLGVHTAWLLPPRFVSLRFGFIFFRRLHLVPPFVLFPLTHFFYSIHVLPAFMLRHFILFLFCEHTLVRLLAYLCTLTSKRGFRSPRSVQGGMASCLSLSTWFLFVATTYTCSVLSAFDVFILVASARTHAHLCCLPAWEACVCLKPLESQGTVRLTFKCGGLSEPA